MSRRIFKILFIIAVAALAAAALVFAKNQAAVVFLILGLVAALFAFCFWPEVSLYAMALSLPVINWNFYLGTFQFSLVEAVSLLALAAYVLRLLLLVMEKKENWREVKWPLFWPFVFFFLSVIISSLNAQHVLTSGWYSVRWILLFYFAYIFLPYNIISSGRILKRTLICLAVSGLAVALMGVVSLYYQDWYNSFFRVQPMEIFGIYPIGDNHNLIAEFLVIITFFILSLKFFFTSKRAQRVCDVLFFFLLVVTVGTFSRTAWIVLAVQSVIYFCIDYFYVQRKKMEISKIILGLIVAVIILIPFTLRMGQLQAENASSTASRLLLTKIAWGVFLSRPAFGYGSGTFVTLVGNNLEFTANYGDALDSHGIWQKLLAENGLFGTLTFAIFILLLFKEIFAAVFRYRREAKLLLPLAVGALGGFIYQWFNTSYYKGKLWLPLAVALTVAVSLKKKYERKYGKTPELQN